MVEDIGKGSPARNVSRKVLTDIGNLPYHMQIAKSQPTAFTPKEYIDKLHQENAKLWKLLADRNKIIEVSRNELQKLRISYQSVQEQNSQLAQANSQMLSELNLGKDQLKLLKHELGCKNTLLCAKRFEHEAEVAHGQEEKKLVHPLEGEDNKNLSHNEMKRRRLSIQYCRSGDGLMQCNDEARRTSSRRQSTIHKSTKQESHEDFKEPKVQRGYSKDRQYSTRRSSRMHLTGPARESIGDVEQSGSTSSNLEEVSNNKNTTVSILDEYLPRRSLPTRGARKVQSYKETPLNVKMRRPE